MKVLTVRYKVDGLTEEQIDQLTLEAVVQGESSDGHPDVEVVSAEVEELYGLDTANVVVTD